MLFKISLCFLLILVIGTFPSLQLPYVTFPTNDSVLKSGDQITIKFKDDGNPPTSSMSGIKIQFMKNQDTQQIPLLTIVENLPNTESQFDFKVPSIKALNCSSGKFYFLMFSDSGKPDKGNISCSPTFTVLEDSSETPSVTFPAKQMTQNNFLRGGIGDIGDIGGGIGIPDILPGEKKTSTSVNTMTSITSTPTSTSTSAPTSASTIAPTIAQTITPTNTPTSIVTPFVSITTTPTNAIMPAVTTQKSAWPSVITASSIDPSKPITAIIPLYSPSDPSSDPGTVVIVVNGPKSTNTKLTASTFQPQKSPNDIGGIESSSTVNIRFIKHGKINCIIMRLGYIFLSLLVMNIQYFGYF
ncbi:hypothetical protein C2G38_2157782 [Gigaspora rosea]|uniref:Yeast cell wall synthesis Kre9/Knh1-like N-terminal domain-containing protein n=1 Tax=Gigaspora rosea TaxID=44941 RepID=A0A397W327_9GLOM|nr:hypothetical protein C2G38_2157782 [Gigaspora rosea]